MDEVSNTKLSNHQAQVEPQVQTEQQVQLEPQVQPEQQAQLEQQVQPEQQGVPEEENDYARILLRVEQWILFTVLVALVPLGFDALKQYGDGLTPSFNSLISNGELVLISAVIIGEIVGELALSGKTHGHLTFFVFGTCCLIFFLSAGVYVLSKNHSQQFPNAFVGFSLLLYLLSIGSGFSSKILMGLKNAI